MKLTLASGSPRRREILTAAGFEFDVFVTDADESLPNGTPPDKAVCLLAERKARKAAKTSGSDGIFVGADTVVVLDDEILGKPADKADAVRMLKELSGRAHTVFTGVAVISGDKAVVFSEATKVFFRELSDEEITRYVETGEPADKAGAYGIQGRGCLLVEKIEGDYFNVVGFPVSRFAAQLKAMCNE